MHRPTSAALGGLLLTLGLSACAGTPAEAPPPVTGDQADASAGKCDAKPLAWTIGQSADADLVARARAESGAKLVRVLHPGEVVTMEYSEYRLNLHVDAAGKVESYSCG